MSCTSRWFVAMFLGLLAAILGQPLKADDASLAESLRQIRAVGPVGKNHAAAVSAAKTVSAADAAALPQILTAMDGANEIATNWLRGAAEAVAQRAAAAGKLPVADLEKFLADSRHAPRARRLSYELIAGVDPTAPQRLTPTLLDDPSLELRRDAVAQLLTSAAENDDQPTARARYQKILFHSRDLDQIKATAARLKELGEPADIAQHMGFVTAWKVIGPFDNVDDNGWDKAYPPEIKVDLAAEYDGQKGKVKWLAHTTDDDYGVVDLTKVLDKHKGAIAYAYVEFLSDREQPCDLRLGCINANKIWLNGELVSATHVYHANEAVDQYLAPGQLKRGKNAILLKICQNEQKEPWAQGWQFQLRVCDAIGTAILSQDRPTKKVAYAGGEERGGERASGGGGD